MVRRFTILKIVMTMLPSPGPSGQYVLYSVWLTTAYVKKNQCARGSCCYTTNCRGGSEDVPMNRSSGMACGSRKPIRSKDCSSVHWVYAGLFCGHLAVLANVNVTHPRIGENEHRSDYGYQCGIIINHSGVLSPYELFSLSIKNITRYGVLFYSVTYRYQSIIFIITFIIIFIMVYREQISPIL